MCNGLLMAKWINLARYLSDFARFSQIMPDLSRDLAAFGIAGLANIESQGY